MNAALRAAVIAEWRGLPERKARPDRWQAPGDRLPKLMQQLGLSERLRETEVSREHQHITLSMRRHQSIDVMQRHLAPLHDAHHLRFGQHLRL